MHDELYQLPLDEFIAGRDALAVRLKAAGDSAGAAEVKRVRKPSVPAWAANQVVWRAASEWERLRTAAAALRKSYETAVAGEPLREAMREQHDAQHACEARAGEILAQYGHAATPAVLQKVGHTLLALAYGAPDAIPGRVEHELQPPGFDTLAGLNLASVPMPRPVPIPPVSAVPKVEAKSQREEQARARAIEKAEARDADAARELKHAQARLYDAEKRRTAAQEEVDAAEATYREAESALRALREKG
jgi:hypothetical protein